MGIFDLLKKFGIFTQTPKDIPGCITNSKIIHDHLKHLGEQKISLNLQVDDRYEQYASLFLKNPKGDLSVFFIDALVPKEGNRFIDDALKATLSYTFEGKRFTFDTAFVGSVPREITTVKIELPRIIEESDRKKGGNTESPLETPLKIRLAHLENVCERSAPLDLKIDKSTKVFKSSFVHVSRGTPPEIFIDILKPKEGNQQIEKSREIHLSYNFQNRHFEFESEFIEIVKKNTTVLKFRLPKAIEEVMLRRITTISTDEEQSAALLERRKFQRVAPATDSPVKVYIGYGKGKTELDNISVGGAAFFTKLTTKDMKLGSAFYKMTLTLPEEERKIVIPKAMVRNIVENVAPSRKSKNLCSLEFFGLKISDQDAIKRYIMKREQEIKEESSGFKEAKERIDSF
jgi:c-di-GMP-binding flagellar brake protein YcgR